MAVAADRNPWIDGPRQKAADFSSFKPDLAPFKGTSEEACEGNTQTHRTRLHRYDGQNVLYLDGHVNFEMRAFYGYEDDNVYTSWDGSDKARGVPPVPYKSQPASDRDSLLVNDPPLGWQGG
jgi:prepilin-type processing-associated H-X9-DG protein